MTQILRCQIESGPGDDIREYGARYAMFSLLRVRVPPPLIAIGAETGKGQGNLLSLSPSPTWLQKTNIPRLLEKHKYKWK